MITVDDGNVVITGDVPSAGVDICKAICGFMEMATAKYDDQIAYAFFGKVLASAMELFEARQQRKEKS